MVEHRLPTPKPTTVEDYLAALLPERRAVLEPMRATIRAAAPGAIETIAYGMPALRTRDDRFLVSYAAFRRHYSLFPASGAVVAALGEAVRPYLAGRGTIRFAVGAEIPTDLVASVVAARLVEVADRDGR